MLFIETNAEIVSLIKEISKILVIDLDTKDFGLQGTSIFFLLENKATAFGIDIVKQTILVNPNDEATVVSAIAATLSSLSSKIEPILGYAESKVMDLIPFMQMEAAS